MLKFFNPPVVLLIVSLLCLFIPGGSQVIQSNTKNNSIDYERLGKIDGLVNEYINKKWLTGAVSIVIKDNQLVQYKGYGYADIATKKRMKINAIFGIM